MRLIRGKDREGAVVLFFMRQDTRPSGAGWAVGDGSAMRSDMTGHNDTTGLGVT